MEIKLKIRLRLKLYPKFHNNSTQTQTFISKLNTGKNIPHMWKLDPNLKFEPKYEKFDPKCKTIDPKYKKMDSKLKISTQN